MRRWFIREYKTAPGAIYSAALQLNSHVDASVHARKPRSATSAPGLGLTPATSAPGLGLPPPTSAPGLGLPRPHLRRDWGSPLPHLRRDWGSPLPHLRRDWSESNPPRLRAGCRGEPWTPTALGDGRADGRMRSLTAAMLARQDSSVSSAAGSEKGDSDAESGTARHWPGTACAYPVMRVLAVMCRALASLALFVPLLAVGRTPWVALLVRLFPTYFRVRRGRHFALPADFVLRA